MKNFVSVNKNSLDETLCVLLFWKNCREKKAIDNTWNLKDVFGKIDKLRDPWDGGQADASLIKYIPGLSNVFRQGKIFNFVPKKAYASWTYADKNTWVYDWANYNSMCIVLPITIKKQQIKLKTFT